MSAYTVPNKVYVARRRRTMKAILVAEHGGKCTRCGYDRCIRALHFHHRDRTTKQFHISFGNTWGIAKLREEAAKFALRQLSC
jgi:hypothetical protein